MLAKTGTELSEKGGGPGLNVCSGCERNLCEDVSPAETEGIEDAAAVGAGVRGRIDNC